MVFKKGFKQNQDPDSPLNKVLDSMDEDVKINFKSMPQAMEALLIYHFFVYAKAQLLGQDIMENAMNGIENRIVEAWKDKQYFEDTARAQKMLHDAEKECYEEDGLNEDKYNYFVRLNIAMRDKAIQELLFRRGWSPQLSEVSVDA